MLEQVQREAAATEAAKFTDAITGLGNRRMFNKEMAKVYDKSGLPDLCGIAFAELDRYDAITTIPNLIEPVLKKIGALIQPMFGSEDLACRFDRGRFGFIFRTADETEIMRLVDRLRDRLKRECPLPIPSQASRPRCSHSPSEYACPSRRVPQML